MCSLGREINCALTMPRKHDHGHIARSCIAFKYELDIVFVVLLRPNAKKVWHSLSFLKYQSNLAENFLNFQREAVITETP